ncbi:hypothetical protein K7711_10875 [Nocardia sp. CA2R105]|uniref:hypothetical protein n=1 Tax=Nocardia coffeae TaxID=2873381 RepID=UPI001CA75892|nr:hypothetical protein [Nocardia coffeae]MBY8856981.1 hypothetical protein [Nocardia coffeae]
MSADGDRQRRGTRLYTFPGGVFEVEESPEDEPGVGVYLEHHPRQSGNDARAFGTEEGMQRLRLVNSETELIGNGVPSGEPLSDRTHQ